MPTTVLSDKPLDAVVSPMVREAYDLWQHKRGQRPMPARADFDPIEMPRLLPYIILVDVEAPNNRLRVRLAGTTIVDMFHSDYTGKYLDEIEFGDMRDKILEEYGLAARATRPIFSDHSFRNLHDCHYNVERVLLPLSNDGETVNMLMAVLSFEKLEDAPRGSNSSKGA